MHIGIVWVGPVLDTSRTHVEGDEVAQSDPQRERNPMVASSVLCGLGWHISWVDWCAIPRLLVWSSMEFSAQQETALKRVARWLESSDQQIYRLFGWAGTGKTTLAKHLGADFYAAFTGKAAYVLQQKGCAATTIHSLIYKPRVKSTQMIREMMERLELEPDNRELQERVEQEKKMLKRPAFTLNLDSPLRGAQLLVIDECSMCNTEMAEDLLSFGCKILVLGDPFQLPPVFGAGYFTNCKPDYLLTEIHRQARENPILDLAWRIREDGRMPLVHSLIIPKASEELALWADQIIVGKNVTRRNSNARMRELLKYTDVMPEMGEKLVCLRNNAEAGLLNGATYEVTGIESGDIYEFDGGICVPIHRGPFVGEEISPWLEKEAEKFDYGYALTCHKSQGSQWDKVLVIDEGRVFRSDSARWQYTAVTRAAKELKVVCR